MGASQPKLLSDGDWATMFKEYDLDGSGTLTRREAVALVNKVGVFVRGEECLLLS